MRLLLALLFTMMTGAALAETEMTYQGCVDAEGRSVPSIRDTTIASVAQGRVEGGVPVIRYNPSVLPQLLPARRLFLFAHVCAGVNLGHAPGQVLTMAQSREADCHALGTLLRSGLLKPDEVEAIEANLVFSSPDWAMVPGPAREFQLLACLHEIAGRPSLTTPAAGQIYWNRCVHTCGDALLKCRKACSGTSCNACQEHYEGCSAMCDFRFPL